MFFAEQGMPTPLLRHRLKDMLSLFPTLTLSETHRKEPIPLSECHKLESRHLRAQKDQQQHAMDEI